MPDLTQEQKDQLAALLDTYGTNAVSAAVQELEVTSKLDLVTQLTGFMEVEILNWAALDAIQVDPKMMRPILWAIGQAKVAQDSAKIGGLMAMLYKACLGHFGDPVTPL